MAAPVIRFVLGPHYYESIPGSGPGNIGAFPGETLLVVGDNLDSVTSVHIGFVSADFAATTSGFGPALDVVVPDTANSDLLFVTNPDGTAQGPRMSVWDPVPGPWKTGLYGLQQIGGGNVNSWSADGTAGYVDFGAGPQPWSVASDGTPLLTYTDLAEHFMNRQNAGNAMFNPAWTGIGSTEPEFIFDWAAENTAFFWLVGGHSSWGFGGQFTPGDIETYGINQPGALVDALRWIKHPSYLQDPSVVLDPEFNSFDGPAYYEFDPDVTPRIAWERDMEVSIGFIDPFLESNDLDPNVTEWLARVMDSTIRVYLIPGTEMDDSLLHYVAGFGAGNIDNEIFGFRSWDNDPYEASQLADLQLIAEYRFGDFDRINSPAGFGGGGLYTLDLPATVLQGAGAAGFIISTSLIDNPDGPGNTQTTPSGPEDGTVFGVYVRADAKLPYQGRRYRFYYARPESQVETPDINAAVRSHRLSFDPAGGVV